MIPSQFLKSYKLARFHRLWDLILYLLWLIKHHSSIFTQKSTFGIYLPHLNIARHCGSLNYLGFYEHSGTCLIKIFNASYPLFVVICRMARTKCTARKSTGGKAPTKHLRAFYVIFHILLSSLILFLHINKLRVFGLLAWYDSLILGFCATGLRS
jgi:hypothetical protein